VKVFYDGSFQWYAMKNWNRCPATITYQLYTTMTVFTKSGKFHAFIKNNNKTFNSLR